MVKASLLTTFLIGGLISVTSAARAEIVGFTPDADFNTPTGYTVDLGGGTSYTFTAIPLDPDDILYRTAALATTGGATAYGGGFIGNGTDFTSYSAGSPIPGNNFGGDFITAPTPRPIDYSLTDTFVALAFTLDGSLYYGYAEVADTTLVSFAYNDVAGGSITTGEAITAPLQTGGVPEPATWAMMVTGFGLLGGAARRRTVALQG